MPTPATFPMSTTAPTVFHDQESTAVPTAPQKSTSKSPHRRSTRTTNPIQPYDPGTGPASQWQDRSIARMARTIDESRFHKSTKDKLFAQLASFDTTIAEHNHSPLCYKTSQKSDPDLPTFREAMSGDNAPDFKKAMDLELEALVKRDTWTLVPRTTSMKTIPGTWAFRIKRRPDGSLNKFKARFCVRGDLQQKYNLAEEDTYSPVISWSTIRMMLVLTQQLGLSTVHLDFSNVFAQADIPEGTEVFLEPPPRYSTNNDYVLRLNKSLYGQVEAPKLWYQKLREGLIKQGLIPSKIDPCLFIGKKVCAIVYVDDVVFFARDKRDINTLIQTFTDDGNKFNW